MVAAVSSFTGIMISIPAGILSDRWGRKRMLLIAAAVFATAPLCYLFVTNVWQLAAVRLYHGAATAIFTPVAMALVSDLFQQERGEKIGWFSTSTLLGRFAAPVVGGSIIGLLVMNPNTSYHAVYVVCAVAGALVFFLSLKIPDDKKKQRTGQSWQETFSAFKTVILNRAIVITAMVEASILFAYGTFETFLPLYAIKTGLTAYEVGIFLSAQVITLALTKPMMGKFSDRHGRKPQIVTGAFIGAFSIAGLSVVTGFFPLMGVSILFGLSQSIVTSATAAYIADLSRGESRGSAMGLLGSVMDIGHTMGPLVSGIVAAWLGFGMSFIGAGIILGLGALVFLLFVTRPSATTTARR
jgi:MFS transporter, DHA1 family, multidrug resistance protein